MKNREQVLEKINLISQDIQRSLIRLYELGYCNGFEEYLCKTKKLYPEVDYDHVLTASYGDIQDENWDVHKKE